MTRLRRNQLIVKQGVYGYWQEGLKNVVAVLPTGGGKSVLGASIIADNQTGGSIVGAHRGELVGQLSLALARENVRHRVIGSDGLRRDCASIHVSELGRNLHDPGARVAVASVDTMIKKDVSQDSFYREINLWAQDEAHHVQKENKWGKFAGMFPQAYGLGLTALLSRADGGGLGADNDGLFHAAAVGAGLREFIQTGYLTGYRIFAPPSDVDYSGVEVTASGDYSPAKLRAAVHASDKIVGDVVAHYLRIAPGKRGITFAVDVEAAQEIARAFRAAGVPAEVVSAKTPDLLRLRFMRQFKAGEILQLVNVDLFGEGVDVPACEVISMVRKTESLQLYIQQFGRALRLLIPANLTEIWDDFTDEQRLAHIAASPKPCGIIIDHVGNVIRHGLPDASRVQSLDRRERRSRGVSDAIPLRTCMNPNGRGPGLLCMRPYERFLKYCPHCGFYPEPPGRSAPDMVDGDLFELDAATLAALRGEAEKIDRPVYAPQGLDAMAVRGLQNRHFERQTAQGALRQTMALWAGWKRHIGHDDAQSYRMFYHRYGVDMMTAQGLGRPDAEKLTALVNEELQKHGVIAA